MVIILTATKQAAVTDITISYRLVDIRLAAINTHHILIVVHKAVTSQVVDRITIASQAIAFKVVASLVVIHKVVGKSLAVAGKCLVITAYIVTASLVVGIQVIIAVVNNLFTIKLVVAESQVQNMMFEGQLIQRLDL